jgi:hypothetical protein
LDRAAAEWAAGATPGAAARSNSYVAQTLSAVHVSGPDAALLQQLRHGIAFSVGRAPRRGLYWVQLLVAPKA